MHLSHDTVHTFLLCVALNIIITTMPKPDSGSWTGGPLYKWAFAATHTFIGAWARIVATMLPGSPFAKALSALNGNDVVQNTPAALGQSLDSPDDAAAAPIPPKKVS